MLSLEAKHKIFLIKDCKNTDVVEFENKMNERCRWLRTLKKIETYKNERISSSKEQSKFGKYTRYDLLITKITTYHSILITCKINKIEIDYLEESGSSHSFILI